jgi:protein ImuA
VEQNRNILDIAVMRMGPAQVARSGETCAATTLLHRGSSVEPLIAALRQHIARIEHAEAQFGRVKSRSAPWLMGLPELDRHLPAQGLLRSGLHDVSPRAYGDLPAAMGFALAIALRRLDSQEHRPILWCRLALQEREHGRLYGHGLERLGLARSRFITVTLKKPQALLWTMEEALKSGALAVVLGDASAAYTDLTVTRRLALAGAQGKSAGLLIFARSEGAATASHTRWVAASMPSRSPPHDDSAPGLPSWNIELTRARGGRPGQWILEWHHALHRFSVVSGLRDRPVHPGADEAGPDGAAQNLALRAG